MSQRNSRAVRRTYSHSASLDDDARVALSSGLCGRSYDLRCQAFPLSRDLEQEEVQEVMDQLQNSSYNKSIVRQVHIVALHKEQQQIAEAVEKTERGDDS